jgi:hypothetical protein
MPDKKTYNDEPSPILSSWCNVYLLVLVTLVVVIGLLYLFTKYFD